MQANNHDIYIESESEDSLSIEEDHFQEISSLRSNNTAASSSDPIYRSRRRTDYVKEIVSLTQV